MVFHDLYSVGYLLKYCGVSGCMVHMLYDEEVLAVVKKMARESRRRRYAYSFSEPTDRVQVMLNAVEPDSYVRPHKHECPDKLEIVQAVCGRIAVVCYDDVGGVLKVVVSDCSLPDNVVSIPAGTWHSMVSLEIGSVMLEIIEGPYDAITHKKFAEWSFDEYTDGARGFLEDLRCKIEDVG